ncbi:MAG: tail-specific protease, partial [Parapedobacter sp.]
DTMQKQESETSVTLQEDKLKKEREDSRLKSKSRTDALQQMNMTTSLGGVVAPDVNEGLDFIQEESLSIMADYVALEKR